MVINDAVFTCNSINIIFIVKSKSKDILTQTRPKSVIGINSFFYVGSSLEAIFPDWFKGFFISAERLNKNELYP